MCKTLKFRCSCRQGRGYAIFGCSPSRVWQLQMDVVRWWWHSLLCWQCPGHARRAGSQHALFSHRPLVVPRPIWWESSGGSQQPVLYLHTSHSYPKNLLLIILQCTRWCQARVCVWLRCLLSCLHIHSHLQWSKHLLPYVFLANADFMLAMHPAYRWVRQQSRVYCRAGIQTHCWNGQPFLSPCQSA